MTRIRDQIAQALLRSARDLAKRAGFEVELEAATLVEPTAAPDKRASGYQAARRSRRNEDWITGGASGNAELGGSMKALRDRSRDTIRNNRYGKQGATQVTSYMTGLRPMSALLAAPGASDKERERVATINRETDDVFRAWSKVCHANGRLRFGGLQTQAVMGMVVSGDSFTRLRPRRPSDMPGLPPFQLEILEADLVDHAQNGAIKDGGWIIQGVEFSRIGSVAAYHMHRTHPGEALLGLSSGSYDTVRVPADGVAHLFPEILARPSQVRGAPWFHAILQDLRDFDGYQDAERVRLRGSASLMGVVESSEEITFSGEDDELPTGINPIRDASGQVVERIRPGTIAYAMQGQSIKFNDPPQTNGFAAYTDVDLHGMAAGALTPYELFTGDLSKANFSSIMYGMGSFWRLMGRFQREVVVPQWGDQIWDRFIDLGRVVRVLHPEAGPVKWVAEPWPIIDPIKQHRGTLIAVRGGWKPLEDAIAETGEDPDRVLSAHVRMTQWAKDNDVILDGIPTTATMAGQAQIVPGEAPAVPSSEDPPDEDEDADVDAAEDGE